MQFDYFEIKSTKATQMLANTEKLAVYLATEWLPKVPREFFDSLTGLLGTLISAESIRGDRFLCANSDIARTDRQWRGMTSWMIGVAFTRHIVQEMGYQWWLPVSALQGPINARKTMTGNWEQPPGPPHRSFYEVTRKKKAKSKLLPDYLVCKLNPSGEYEFAFVESKGTKKSIGRDNWLKAPQEWVNQSKSAQLYFKKSKLSVSRNLITATRYYPEAKKVGTRKLTVRAWNENSRETNSDPEIFAHLLANHYAAICWKIGYLRLARIMELAGTFIVNNSENSIQQFNAQIDNEGLGDVLPILMDPTNRRYYSTLDLNVYPRIMDYADNPVSLTIGRKNLTLRFTSSAYEIMGSIVALDSSQIIPRVLRILGPINQIRNTYLSDPLSSQIVTLDGIALFEQDLLQSTRS